MRPSRKTRAAAPRSRRTNGKRKGGSSKAPLIIGCAAAFLAIAGVLAMKPDILVLDEPTAGLDPKGRDEILDQIAKLKEETGITVILVSHSMEDVAKYVERIIVMNQGSVMYDDVPREVFKHYRELEEVGLAAPQVTYIMQELKKNGLDVKTDAITVGDARDRILEALGRRKK